MELLKDKNVYEVIDLSKKQKVIKNYQIFNIKSDSHYRSQLVAKEFSQIKGINVIYYETTYLFFLNQQFITWSIRADHGSYFITTYIQTEATWKNKKKNKRREMKEKRKRKLNGKMIKQMKQKEIKPIQQY